MTDYAHWTAVGMPDEQIARFLCVNDRERFVVAVLRYPGDLHGVACIPFDLLVRLNPAGRVTPWTVEDLHELAAAHIDADRHLVA